MHEAYLRLVGQQRIAWQSRTKFFGVAAQMMRRILIDHRTPCTEAPRRAVPVIWGDRFGATQPRTCDLLALDHALNELTTIDRRGSQIMELRYFGGLSEQEVAEVLSISRSTMTREWQAARAWLPRRLTARSE